MKAAEGKGGRRTKAAEGKAAEKQERQKDENGRGARATEEQKQQKDKSNGKMKAAERTRVTGGGHVSGWNRHRLQRSQGRCP